MHMTDAAKGGSEQWVYRQLREKLATCRQIGSNISIELYDCEVGEQDRDLYLSPSIRMNLSLGQRRHARGYIDGNAKSETYALGELTLIPSNLPMRLSHVPGRVNYISCGFDFRHYETLWLPEIGSLDRARLGACLDMRDVETTRALKQIVREMLREDFGSGIACECLAEFALISALRYLCIPQRSSRAGGLAGWQLRRVTDRIHDSSEVPPTLAELATLCRISPRHLMRGFLAETGRTIGVVIREAQTHRAKELLRATDLTMSDIAAGTGFSSASNFASAFRRTEGISPSDYRRRI